MFQVEVIPHQETTENKRKQEFCFKHPDHIGFHFDVVGILKKFGAEQKYWFNSKLFLFFYEGGTF